MKDYSRWGWNTDFSELPKEKHVLFQYSSGRWHLYWTGDGRPPLTTSAEVVPVAWHPQPDEYSPPKPEQLTKKDTRHFFHSEIIEMVEKRTREIVEWERKYEGVGDD